MTNERSAPRATSRTGSATGPARSRPAAPSRSAADQSPRCDSGLRILVVDNDARFVSMLRSLLEIDEHEVTATSEPRTAIDVATAQRFDVAILDLSMPTTNGWEVARAVRARQPCTGIILCTGWGTELVSPSDAARHVDVVLAKPFRLAELRQAIRDARRRATARDRVS